MDDDETTTTASRGALEPQLQSFSRYYVSHTGSRSAEKANFPAATTTKTLFTSGGTKTAGHTAEEYFGVRTRRQLYENARGRRGIEKPRTSSSGGRIGRAGGKFINFSPLLSQPPRPPRRANRLPIIPFPIYSIFRRFSLLSFQAAARCDLSTMELNMLSLLYFLLLLSLPSLGLYMYLGPF